MPAPWKSLASLTAALALAAGLTTVVGETAAGAAVPATIPLTSKNDSGRSDQIYVYSLGTELSTGRQGWAHANGVFHPLKSCMESS